MLFGAVYAADGSATDVVIEVAREFSPRIEIGGPRALDAAQDRQVVLDLSGSTRLFGDAARDGRGALSDRCRSRAARARSHCGHTYRSMAACVCRQ